MKRSSKASTTSNGDGQPEPAPPSDHGFGGGFKPTTFIGLSLVSVVGFLVLFAVLVVSRDPPSDVLWTVNARNSDFKVQKALLQENEMARPVKVPDDKLLGNLLSTGFDEKSCLSRYQSLLYRQGMPRRPSPHLVSKLRSYETRHKKCGPHTFRYLKMVEILKSGKLPSEPGCKYVVWVSFSGLGNRILTLASAFLYALLTDRVLLVDRGLDIPDLFCEPFPGASWLLPLDFPLAEKFDGFDQKSNESYGNLLKTNSSIEKPYLYLHLVHNYGDRDKLFFCDQDQANFEKIPWLVIKTDNYFIPSLFLIPSFEQELHNLFPEKETVFHFLGRYLFHPTNPVWGLVTRYHEAYLSKADVKIGLQIRVFDNDPGPFDHVLEQILSCTIKEDILPKFDNREEPMYESRSSERKRVAVLVTSLSPGYFERVRDLYWENPAFGGEIIGVYQPSHEGYQKTGKVSHSRKAWAEMYLLSLTEKLVTSSWSTFGYVAQGLGGIRPWILYKPENRTAPDPPCRRAASIEPCFHAPPFYDCKMRRGVDTGAVVPHVKHCEDMSWGLKLVGKY